MWYLIVSIPDLCTLTYFYKIRKSNNINVNIRNQRKNAEKLVVSPSTISPISTVNCLFVCFVAFRPKSTAMVTVGRSVHLTTLFPGQA